MIAILFQNYSSNWKVGRKSHSSILRLKTRKAVSAISFHYKLRLIFSWHSSSLCVFAHSIGDLWNTGPFDSAHLFGRLAYCLDSCFKNLSHLAVSLVPQDSMQGIITLKPSTYLWISGTTPDTNIKKILIHRTMASSKAYSESGHSRTF